MATLTPLQVPIACPVCAEVIVCTVNVRMVACPEHHGHVVAADLTDAPLADVYLHIFAEHPEVEITHADNR